MIESGARLKSRLARNGLRFGVGADALTEAFREKVGGRRFARYLRLAEAFSSGAASASEFYGIVGDAEEAALFQSFQAPLVAAVGRRLYEAAVAPLPAGGRLVELGAWHGALADAFAAMRPDVDVVAVEREARVARAGRSRFRRPNLSIVRGSYAAPPRAARDADAVVSCLGVDFAFGEPPHPLQGGSIRGAPIHAETTREAAPLFDAARKVSKTDAVLAVGLRAPNRGRALAIVDAAAAAGFAFVPRKSDVLVVGGATIFFGVFRRGKSAGPEEMKEDAFLRFWRSRRPPPKARRGTFVGEDALCAYEALSARRTVSEVVVELAPDLPARVETGRARGVSYVFTQAEDGVHELKVRKDRAAAR